MKLNFSIQLPIPDNHQFYFRRGNFFNSDFEHRINLYKDFSFELSDFYPLDSASQFLIILNDESEIKQIKDRINGFKIIRATSPIDGKSVWIEIFNQNVSKGLGGKFLCDMLEISPKNTIGLGNDYNDLDLLDWVEHSFIVSSAPETIKYRYKQCADNQSNPLTDALCKIGTY
jgi:hydroxymethylpyrimidine pyrophosphatase-like HAD family hydrolase